MSKPSTTSSTTRGRSRSTSNTGSAAREPMPPRTQTRSFANNTGMKQARVFGTPGGTRIPTIEAKPLFPFSSAYTIYAGCLRLEPPGPERRKPRRSSGDGQRRRAGGRRSGSRDAPASRARTGREKRQRTGEGREGHDHRHGLQELRATNSSSGSTRPMQTAPPPAAKRPWVRNPACPGALQSARRRSPGATGAGTVPSVAVQNLAAATTKTIDLGSEYLSGACP